MVLLNYNFTIPLVSTCGAMRNLHCIPVMCLCGPYFLMAWNIHVSCNLLCAMCGIVKHGIATLVTATQAARLGKYLTMPNGKNATKQSFP